MIIIKAMFKLHFAHLYIIYVLNYLYIIYDFIVLLYFYTSTNYKKRKWNNKLQLVTDKNIFRENLFNILIVLSDTIFLKTIKKAEYKVI